MINMFRSKAGASLTGAEAAALYDAKHKPATPVEVEYAGFLGKVTRQFTDAERAEQWARQVGKSSVATFTVL
jgi:hypothetical protein